MRSSESPLASLPCPDSVGHPSLPLLLLVLQQGRKGEKKLRTNCQHLQSERSDDAETITGRRGKKDNLCVELDLPFDFSVPHAGGCRKLGFIL